MSSFVLYVLVVPYDFACVQVAINVIHLKQTECGLLCFTGPLFYFFASPVEASFLPFLTFCVFFSFS